MRTTTKLSKSHEESITDSKGNKIGDFSCVYNHEDKKKPESIEVRMSFGGGVIQVQGNLAHVKNITDQFQSSLSATFGLIDNIPKTQK